MVRSRSTRIRQELEALTLEWAAGRAESILHSQAGPPSCGLGTLTGER